jgi:hypothetical protein
MVLHGTVYARGVAANATNRLFDQRKLGEFASDVAMWRGMGL